MHVALAGPSGFSRGRACSSPHAHSGQLLILCRCGYSSIQAQGQRLCSTLCVAAAFLGPNGKKIQIIVDNVVADRYGAHDDTRQELVPAGVPELTCIPRWFRFLTVHLVLCVPK